MLPSKPQAKIPFSSLAAGFILLAGLVLRLRQYLSGRSLWLDEAMLALNIVQRNFGDLLKPLDYDQGAPLGFLLLEKLIASLFGNGELSLRLLSLLAGSLALFLFYLFLLRFLNPTGWLPALTFFAISDTLIYYTAELKQYIFDVFSLVALLLLLLAYPPNPKLPRFRALLPLLGAGVLVVWFSHPSIFLLAGIGLTLLWENRHNWQALRQIGLVISAWLISFALVFSASLHSLAANNFLLAYWQEYFMPLPPWEHFDWFLEATANSLNYFGLTLPIWLTLALLLAGFVTLGRRQPTLALVFGLTLLAGFGASALGKYPMGGRMILFSAPISLSLFGAAFDGLHQLLKRLRPQPGWLSNLIVFVMAGFALLNPAQLSLEHFITPRMQENMHPALQTLRAKLRPDDAIYIYYGAMPAFRYYAPFYGFSANTFQAGAMTYYQQLTPTLADLASFKGLPRVWLLFSHIYAVREQNDLDSVLAYLKTEKMGKCKLESREPGTSVLLYLCNFAP
jgi:hypothetical protein